MLTHWRKHFKGIVFVPLLLALAFIISCGTTAEPVVVEKEVVKEVIKEVVVVKEVPVEVVKVVVATPTPGIAPVAPPSGTLTVGLRGLGVEATDPILETRAAHAMYHAPIWDALLGFNYEAEYGGVGPGVAKEWGMDPGGNSWTFRLRDGLVFHNGEPLTSEDVKFSLERSMYHPQSVVSDGRRLMKELREPSEDAIELIDPLTLRIHTDGPKVHLWSLLTRAVYQAGQIMPQEYIETNGDEYFREKPIGSGPWQFVRRVPGDYFEYEAFDKSYRGVPSFQGLRLLLVPEEATRVAMIRTGQADIIDILPESAPEVRAAGNLEVTEIGGAILLIVQFWGLYFDEAQDLAVQDVRVRQALSLAIDREAIIDFTLNGYAKQPMPFASFPTSVDMDIPRWQKWSQDTLVYDPERAKQLLREAGYENGFDVTFWSTNFSGTPYMNAVSEAVTGFWEEIGVNVDLKVVEYGVWAPWTKRSGHKNWDEGMNGAASIYRNAGRPLAIARYHTTFHPEGNHYVFGDTEHMTAEGEEFARLYGLASGELDPAKRQEYTDAAIQMVADTWYTIPIMEGVGLFVTDPRRVGFWKGIYGRAELGDVFHRIPRAEGNPWR